jgi:gluconolactonase
MSSISRRSVLAASAAIPFASWAAPAPGSYGMIRRINPALDELVAPDAVIEQVGWGYQWSEGPVWVKDGGYLLFSDPPQNVIYQWSKAAASASAEAAAAARAAKTPPAKPVPPYMPTVFMKPSGYSGKQPDPTLREPGSNGLAIDASGALVMCDSGTRAIAKVDLKTKAKTVIADKFEGRRFNSPNDLCIAKSGAIYFTDPPFGLTDGITSAAKEQPFSGVYRLTPDGTVTVIDKQLNYPNGVALSPDEGTLFVTNSDKARPVLMAYTLGADGLPQSSEAVFDMTVLMTPDAKGLPDGMKIDQDGNMFVAGPGGILVLSKEAKLLGIIAITDRASPNCAFAEDGSTLYICATDIVARIRLKTKAANWG